MRPTQSVVMGYNHNIRHGGRVFHVQTEDAGAAVGRLVTHVFHHGVAIASRQTAYKELLGAPNLTAKVKKLLQQQHKAMLRELRDGRYDEVIGQLLGAKTQPVPATAPPASATRGLFALPAATTDVDPPQAATRPAPAVPHAVERPAVPVTMKFHPQVVPVARRAKTEAYAAGGGVAGSPPGPPASNSVADPPPPSTRTIPPPVALFSTPPQSTPAVSRGVEDGAHVNDTQRTRLPPGTASPGTAPPGSAPLAVEPARTLRAAEPPVVAAPLEALAPVAQAQPLETSIPIEIDDEPVEPPARRDVVSRTPPPTARFNPETSIGPRRSRGTIDVSGFKDAADLRARLSLGQGASVPPPPPRSGAPTPEPLPASLGQMGESPPPAAPVRGGRIRADATAPMPAFSPSIPSPLSPGAQAAAASRRTATKRSHLPTVDELILRYLLEELPR